MANENNKIKKNLANFSSKPNQLLFQGVKKQHSLKCYQYGGHFRALYDLYEKGELRKCHYKAAI